jgi:hypothetical protein
MCLAATDGPMNRQLPARALGYKPVSELSEWATDITPDLREQSPPGPRFPRYWSAFPACLVRGNGVGPPPT